MDAWASGKEGSHVADGTNVWIGAASGGSMKEGDYAGFTGKVVGSGRLLVEKGQTVPKTGVLKLSDAASAGSFAGKRFLAAECASTRGVLGVLPIQKGCSWAAVETRAKLAVLGGRRSYRLPVGHGQYNTRIV